ncbi:polysaccharide deacetylase family protein [Ammonicoccus fulvus]|uniref:Polysaccharide deacetylase family protein n=1 Tax=Ammonicoccus fulvus TaxID=3138240 RepID=A0ABZ3FSI0_9ACTN
MRTRLLGGLAALTLTATLAACGTPPAPQTASDPAASDPVAATSAAPTPTPSPTPSVDPTALKPGTNHSNAAAAYAYEAKDIQACLLVPQASGSTPSAGAASATATPGRTPTANRTASAAPEVAGTCPSDRKIVFLTLDDGPNDRITPKVLDALKEANAPATFFYVANSTGLEGSDPQVTKRTIAEGHSIDIHTYSHNYKYLYPGGRGNAENILADREKAVASIKKVLGDDYAVSGYRYPGGHMSWKNLDESSRRLAAEGAYWLDWNAMNGDAEQSAPTSVEGQLSMVKRTMRESGNPNVVVLLMHDHLYADLTVQAIPEIVSYYREQGYEFGVLN